MNFEPEERSSNALEEGEEQPPILPPPDAELEPVPEASLTESPRRFPNLMVWGAILATVALAGGIGFWQGRQSQNVTAEASASEKPRAVPVKFVTVEPSEIEEASEFVGTLEAAKTATLRSQVEGQIIEIDVRPGDEVEAGDAIAQIDPREAAADLGQAEAQYARAQARLAELEAGTRAEEIAAAEANVDRTQAERQQAQARLDELKAGTRVEDIAAAEANLDRANAQLEELRDEALASVIKAEGEVAERRSALILARTNLRRQRQLEAEGAISTNDLDRAIDEERRARASLVQSEAGLVEAQQRWERLQKGTSSEEIAQAEAEVAAAQSELEKLRNGSRPEEIAQAEAKLAAAEADVAEAQSELEKLRNGSRPEEIAQAEAEVKAARAEIEAQAVGVQDTQILAPFAGIVGDIPLKIGDFLRKGDELTTLTQNDVLELRVAIPLEKAPQLRVGLPVEVTDAEGEPLSRGRVSFVSPQANATAQTILAKVDVDNPTGKLRDRQFVRARVIWNQRPSAVVVPSNAVVFEGENRFVYIAQGNNEMVAKKQPVKLGVVNGDTTEIVEGLNPGDRLIISGIQKLADGKPIQSQ
ncbi:MAG TPA: efflux RND transporter periplasmic adaptor subunit [Oscillatoriales cyanobacterium M4454_W2019_049]|nr:efflux RND transporter periplasmic adaptor subunit [Oscillatoriales cyanobacterium M4454_W2019_049]